MNKDKTTLLIDKSIRVCMIIFVIGGPFSISLAQIGLCPALVMWLFKMIFINRGKFNGTFIDIGIAIYLIAELITSIFCINPKSAFSGYQGEWQIIMIWMIINTFNKDNIKPLLKIIFFVSVVIAIYGIWQYFSGVRITIHAFQKGSRIVISTLPKNSFFYSPFFHIIGLFGSHLTFGGYYAMISFLGLALTSIAYREHSKKTWIYLFGTIIIIFSVYGSFSRAAWAGFIGGLLTYCYLKLKNKKLIIIVLLIFFLCGLLMYFSVSGFRNKVNTLKDFKGSPRWECWRVALRMMKDHPIIGIGNKNYHVYYDDYANPDDKWRFRGHPHNDYFSIHLTSGILGLLGYLMIWFLLLKNSVKFIRENRKDNYLFNAMIGLTAGVVSLLVAGLGQNYFTDSETSMLLWFFTGLIIVLYYSDKNKVLFHKNLFRGFKK